MAAEELAILVKSRQYVRSRATRLINLVTPRFSELSDAERCQNIDKLSNCKLELDNLNQSIFPLLIKTQIAAEELESKMLENETYDDSIVDCLSKLKTSAPPLLPPLASPLVSPAPIAEASPLDSSLTSSRNGMPLPKISLPHFSNGETEDFGKFIKGFEKMLSRYNLDSFEKFLYLRNQLHGSPLSLVDSIKLHQQDYDHARALLVKAFDTGNAGKENAIRRLSQLNLDASKDSYTFIGEIEAVLNDIEVLKITLDDGKPLFYLECNERRFSNTFDPYY